MCQAPTQCEVFCQATGMDNEHGSYSLRSDSLAGKIGNKQGNVVSHMYLTFSLS